MFQRFLGSKVEHSDPLVRAKAYASGTFDQEVLSAALATETAPQVLLEVVNKSTDVKAILGHTNSASLIPTPARLRLLDLASEPLDTESVVWKQVYERAITEQWGELPEFIARLRAASGYEHVALGALAACTSFGPELLSQELLQDLVCNCQSSPVRLAAAHLITTPQALEQCCREVKDKDKNVYRDLKTRLDLHKEREKARALALTLNAACAEVKELQVVAQPETIAMAAARVQKVEEQIGAVVEAGAELEEVVELQQRFAAISPEVNARIAAARAVLTTRRELQATLASLAETAAASTTAAATRDEIQHIRKQWHELPDNTDIETRRFDAQADAVIAALIERQRNLDVSAALGEQLEVWERTTEPRDPEKALLHMETKWASFEKPLDEALLAPLKQRFHLVCEGMQIKAQHHQEKRAQNSAALVELLNEFKLAMRNGDLKVATSCHAKLKHRLNTELLEAGVRKDAETELRQSQAQLDEYRKWRHFGTIQARDNLIGEANKLLLDPPASPKKLAEQIRDLRESWKKLDQGGDGRSSSTQWQTFSDLLKEAYKPAKKHFNNLSKERKANEKVKRELLQTLEELHASTDWENPNWSSVCEQDKEARLQWLKTGAVDFKVRKELDHAYEQITGKLNTFIQDERDRELRRRELLIAQLQKEVASEDIRSVAETAKRMQRNWRPTVQADRPTEQRLWKEFRTVCDSVFTQLKDAAEAEKSAWRAEADQRNAACAALDLLLKDAQEVDDRAVNAAKGQADAIRKEWGQKSAIPKAVMIKLERRFSEAMKSYQQRARQIARQHELHRQKNLEQMAELCQQAEQMAVAADVDADRRAALETAWSDLAGHTDGAAAKMLVARHARAQSAMDGNQQHRQEITEDFEKNLNERKELCLLGELIAELPSPDEYAAERMQLQVERLKSALQGGVKEKHLELQDLLDRWFEIGGVAEQHWPQLHQRFTHIRDAAAGR